MRGISIVVAVAVILSLFLVAGCLGAKNGPNLTANGTNQANSTMNQTPPVTECTGPVCGADGNTYPTDCDATIAKVAVLYPGACKVEPTCTDTDNGVNTDVQGTVTKGNETHTDYCIDSSQVIEYSCLSNAITMASIICPSGKECKDGACIVKEVIQPPVIPSGCSGPSSPNSTFASNVTFNGTTYSSVCVDYGSVKDYFCKDNALASQNSQCDPGSACQDGRCNPLQTTCVSTNGPNDTAVRGQVTISKGMLNSQSTFDVCFDEMMLNKYYCAPDNSLANHTIDCGTGRKCYNGRCVRSACTETDNGKDLFDAGVTTVAGVDYVDRCVGDNIVREYYCYGDDVWTDDLPCPSNYTCSGGRCVPY